MESSLLLEHGTPVRQDRASRARHAALLVIAISTLIVAVTTRRRARGGVRGGATAASSLVRTGANNTRDDMRADANAVFLDQLLDRVAEFSYDYSFDNVECTTGFRYGFCHAASCTRHAPADGAVEIAACSCTLVLADDDEPAEIAFTASATALLAQSPAFVAALRELVSDDDDVMDDARGVSAALCGAFASAEVYPHLRPDFVSLPAAGNWVTAEVASVECDKKVATAACDGAPCFLDPRAIGPLNLTCLCPVLPAGGDNETFRLTAPDVGHLGGCSSYRTCDGEEDTTTTSAGAPAACNGPCAIQASVASHSPSDDKTGLSGTALRKWATNAVDSMSLVDRTTDTAICRDWMYALN